MDHPTTDTSHRPLQVAVIGAGEADAGLALLAEEVGEELARRGAVLVCGGRGGVMAAASRGARRAGGLAIGILPGADATASPPAEGLSAAIFTGIGQARNLCVVLSGAAVIAVGGGWGTLSEIALARKHGLPVVLLRSWRMPPPLKPEDDDGLFPASSASEAVAKAFELADRRHLGLFPLAAEPA